MTQDNDFAKDEFVSVVGREFDFFGVCCNEFKLDGLVWEALEDGDDGYRSYLGSVIRKNSSGIFFGQALARVVVVDYEKDYLSGFSLVDTRDGHVWLEFGTDDHDDYYPQFYFHYQPKAVKSPIAEVQGE